MTDKTNLLDQLEAEGAKGDGPTLAQLTELAELAMEREGDVAKAEAAVKRAKAELNKIILDKLPKAMLEAKCEKFQVGERTITAKEEMTCSIPKDNSKALALLRTDEFGASDMISNTLTIAFDKGQDNAVQALIETAAEMGLTAERSETVNTASVKALLTARRKENKNDDLSVFGAFVVTKAKIK